VVDRDGDGGGRKGVGVGGGGNNAGGGVGGFKKGGFKSSFTAIGSGGAGTTVASGGVGLKKNVLGDDDDDVDDSNACGDANDPTLGGNSSMSQSKSQGGRPNAGGDGGPDEAESDTDEEYVGDDVSAGGGYYDPRRPTGCFTGCGGAGVGVSEG